jgi:hypothetical protein
MTGVGAVYAAPTLDERRVLVSNPTPAAAGTVPMPVLSAETPFDDAAALAVDYLKQAVPLTARLEEGSVG